MTASQYKNFLPEDGRCVILYVVMEIRYDSLKVDKVFKNKYLEELDMIIKGSRGLEDLSRYRSAFEKDYSSYVGSKYVFLTDSGTCALLLSLVALGIGKGDKVIIPAVTHPSTALAVMYAGAEPCLVDIKADDLTVGLNKIGPSLDARTRAIIPVHLYGIPCNMQTINAIAKRHNLKVIEDACQSEGSLYRGAKTGALADFGVFSFSYYKTISSIDGRGGCVVTNQKDYFDRLLKVFGNKDKNLLRFDQISFLDLLVIRTKLKFINLIERSKREAQNRYERGLRDVDGIKIFYDPHGANSVRLFYVISSAQRDKMRKYLKAKGVVCENPYLPLYRLGFLSKKGYRPEDFPVAESYYRQALILPLYPFMDLKEVDYVVDMIRDYLSTLKII